MQHVRIDRIERFTGAVIAFRYAVNAPEIAVFSMALASEIAEKAPVAVAGSKRMINYARDHSIADGLDYIATWQAGMFAPPHMMESFAAKAQKRDPVFPDLAPLKKKM